MTTVQAPTTFTVPLPPRELSPNARVHWAAKASATSEYRQAVKVFGLAYRRKHHLETFVRARVSLVFAIKGGRGVAYCPRDEANAVAAFKAGYDGIVAAGFVQDDSAKYMHMGGVAILRTKGPYVLVTIEDVAP